MEMSSAIERLSALAHPARLAAFRLLIRAGTDGLPAGEIARLTGAPPSTLSSQLAILERSGLTRSRRDGRSILHAADYEAMGALVTYLAEDCCGGAPEACPPTTAFSCKAPA
jgi:ArsR family transcriptional regulator, arsenate/arsenite/antimonite-responsive transcriptional repressor